MPLATKGTFHARRGDREKERETEVSRSNGMRSVDQNLARDLRPTRLLPRIQLYRWR